MKKILSFIVRLFLLPITFSLTDLFIALIIGLIFESVIASFITLSILMIGGIIVARILKVHYKFLVQKDTKDE